MGESFYNFGKYVVFVWMEGLVFWEVNQYINWLSLFYDWINLSTWWIFSWWQCDLSSNIYVFFLLSWMQILKCAKYISFSFQLLYHSYFTDMQLVKKLML